MLHSDSVYNVTSEPTLVSSGIIPNVERHSGSIASQRRGRANSPVLATMLSADGALPTQALPLSASALSLQVTLRTVINDQSVLLDQECVDLTQVFAHLHGRPL